MGNSGYFDLTGTRGFTVRIHWAQTARIAENVSDLSVTDVQVKTPNWYGLSYFLDGFIRVGGQNAVTFSSSGGTHWVTLAGTAEQRDVFASVTGVTKPPWTVESLPHSADGSGSALFEVSLTGWMLGVTTEANGNGWTVSGSRTEALARIPRTSEPSVTGPVVLGGELEIHTNRASDVLTHRILWEFAGQSGVIGESVGDSVLWTPPLALAKAIPDRTSEPLTITCITLADGEELGSAAVTVSASVPDTEETRPRIVAFALSPAGGLPEAFAGLYVQGKTAVQAELEAESAYSEIASCLLTVEGKSWEGGLSGLLTRSGSQTVTGVVTDLRGFRTEVVREITVLPYVRPRLTAAPGQSEVLCCRCDTDGNPAGNGVNLRIACSAVWSSVAGKNTCSLHWSVTESGGTSALSGGELPITEGAADVILPGAVPSVMKAYQVVLTLSDTVGEENKYQFRVPTMSVPFHLRDGGNGAAFGKYAEGDNLLDVAWNLRVQGEVQLDQPYFTSESGETEWLFPPMEAGVEYRTAERFLGRPVYRKLIAHQFTDGLSGSQSMKIPHGITGLEMALRVELISAGYVFPYVTGSTSLVVTACNASEITLTNAGSTWTNTERIWYFDVKYLKNL